MFLLDLESSCCNKWPVHIGWVWPPPRMPVTTRKTAYNFLVLAIIPKWTFICHWNPGGPQLRFGVGCLRFIFSLWLRPTKKKLKANIPSTKTDLWRLIDGSWLVGGWTNPSEKICSSNWIISPRIGLKIKNHLKPQKKQTYASTFKGVPNGS